MSSGERQMRDESAPCPRRSPGGKREALRGVRRPQPSDSASACGRRVVTLPPAFSIAAIAEAEAE